MCMQLRSKWKLGVLVLLMALFVTPQSARAQYRQVAAKTKRKAKKKSAKAAAPVVSRAQMELAQQMVRNAYTLGRGLEVKQRVSLMTRLLYTMRPEIMAPEKKQWAEELFTLAQRLPRNEAVEVDSARNSAIATAAARVAVYDADGALELLDTLPSQHGNQEDA